MSSATTTSPPGDVPRREFLTLVTLGGAAAGVVGFALPFIDYMNPSGDVLALASVEVALELITPGMGITVVWRGRPIFVRHRTPTEIKQAQDAQPNQLRDPQADWYGSSRATTNGSSLSEFAPILAACRSATARPTRAANGADGSVRATAAPSTPRGASALDRRPRTSRSRRTSS